MLKRIPGLMAWFTGTFAPLTDPFPHGSNECRWKFALSVNVARVQDYFITEKRALLVSQKSEPIVHTCA